MSGLLRLLAPLILLAASARVARAQEPAPLPSGFEFRTFSDDSGPHRYLVYTPETPPPTAGWPVLLFLHGAGQRGADARLLMSNTMAVAIERARASNRPWPFLTVLPQCEDENGRALTAWSAESPDGRRALRILDEVRRIERCDPKHTILAGWSMGGYGAWSLAASSPETFSKVLVISGGSDESALDVGRLAAARVPVWAIHGRRDALIPDDSSRRLVNELNSREGVGQFTSLDAGHDVWRLVLGQSAVRDWLADANAAPPQESDFREPPLPAWSDWYLANVTATHRLQHGFQAEIDNRSLAALSSQLRQTLAESGPQSGTLADLRREFGSGTGAIAAELRNLRYSADVGEVNLQGVSGGWARLSAQLRLELAVGETELTSGEHWARADELTIEFGRHRPAELLLDIQPVSTASGIELRLLSARFVCGEDNWFIQPPQNIDVRSPSYTAWHISTGLVGSLYLARDEIVEQVLSTVPELLQRAERDLRDVRVPELARLLSPLPVLVPDVRLSPTRIRVSPRGLVAEGDFLATTIGRPGVTLLDHSPVRNPEAGADGAATELALDAITELSRLHIAQNLMKVNVLDISSDRFERLTRPETMRSVFVDGLPASEAPLRAVLRLLEPLEIRPDEQGSADSHTARMVLSTPSAAVDFWQAGAAGGLQPIARIVFALEQPVTVRTVDAVAETSAASPPAGVSEAITVRWEPDSTVRVVRVDSLDGTPPPGIDEAEFATLFLAAWREWAADHGQQRIGLSESGAGLKLRKLEIDPARLRLEFAPISAFH